MFLIESSHQDAVALAHSGPATLTSSSAEMRRPPCKPSPPCLASQARWTRDRAGTRTVEIAPKFVDKFHSYYFVAGRRTCLTVVAHTDPRPHTPLEEALPCQRGRHTVRQSNHLLWFLPRFCAVQQFVRAELLRDLNCEPAVSPTSGSTLRPTQSIKITIRWGCK